MLQHETLSPNPVSFRILCVFIVVAHHRRHAIHFNVTPHPTAEWTAQQIAEDFPWDSAPDYLLHDREVHGAPTKVYRTSLPYSSNAYPSETLFAAKQ